MKKFFSVCIVLLACSCVVAKPPTETEKIVQRLEKAYDNPEIEVRAANDNVILNGWVNSEEEKERIVKLAETYLPRQPMSIDERLKRIQAKIPLNDRIQVFLNIKEAPPLPRINLCHVLLFVPANLKLSAEQAFSELQKNLSSFKTLKVCGLAYENLIFSDPDSSAKSHYQLMATVDHGNFEHLEIKKLNEKGAPLMQVTQHLRVDQAPVELFASVSSEKSLDKSYLLFFRSYFDKRKPAEN